MKNRISVYVGPPLGRLLENEKNVSGRLNQVADRYTAIIRKSQLPDLTPDEWGRLKLALSSSFIDTLFIEYLHDEVEDLEEKIRPLSYAQRVALIEAAGF